MILFFLREAPFEPPKTAFGSAYGSLPMAYGFSVIA
jgi:hypothetical protein